MKPLLFVFTALIFLSCSKKADTVIPYSEATYKVTIALNWTSTKFGVPPGAHVTGIIGMVHSKDTFLWKPNLIATPGLEDVAEVGNNTKMNAELDAIFLKSKALSKFTIAPPAITGTVESTLTFNTNFSYISFASMIAPSPDWFMGVHDINLFNNKTWVNDETVNIMVYDAGTEEGDRFAYDNAETSPRKNIGLLTPVNASVLANGNPSVSAIGTIRFIKN